MSAGVIGVIVGLLIGGYAGICVGIVIGEECIGNEIIKVIMHYPKHIDQELMDQICFAINEGKR